LRFHPAVLKEISPRARALNWRLRICVRVNEIIAIMPAGAAIAGLAVDVGTTKVACYLVDLSSGQTLAKAGAMNPQIAYGEDVISRIAYTEQHKEGRQALQKRLVKALNDIIGEMCREAKLEREQIVDAVVVGNTAMHHLFAGLPVSQLGHAPYVPAVSEACDLPPARSDWSWRREHMCTCRPISPGTWVLTTSPWTWRAAPGKLSKPP